jgi:F-type H+-transporting ATPase subunit epsilon
MQITVLSPDRPLFQGTITSVKVPGTNGQFQVLNNHAPIISSLEAGVVTLVTSQGKHEFYNDSTGIIESGDQPGKIIQYRISGGFIEVLNNEVNLLVTGVSGK